MAASKVFLQSETHKVTKATPKAGQSAGKSVLPWGQRVNPLAKW